MTWRALVVDDDASTGMALLQSQPDVEVADAAWMSDAVKALWSTQLDMVIVNRHLRDGDGLELVRTMRTYPVLAGVPVIVLAAGGDEGDAAAAREAGADEYLRKPVDPAALAELCRRLVGAEGGSSPQADSQVRRSASRFNRQGPLGAHQHPVVPPPVPMPGVESETLLAVSQLEALSQGVQRLSDRMIELRTKSVEVLAGGLQSIAGSIEVLAEEVQSLVAQVTEARRQLRHMHTENSGRRSELEAAHADAAELHTLLRESAEEMMQLQQHLQQLGDAAVQASTPPRATKAAGTKRATGPAARDTKT
jgi:response regulator RpfG family c-di-GMP phosphodiesterase